MAPGLNTPYNPSDNSAPFMELPEHVYGFIDLKTLADIHRYLGESEADEDIVLANWIKVNYLYDPIDQGGRTIRTTEGFSNLDRAYRRVRSLTNKAQDKWPFFDRNWKTMSSTTVRNNARGEAAPGVSLPGMNNEPHDSHVTNGLDTTEASPAPQLQVPFGTKQPSRYSVLGKSFPRPAQQTPIPLPANTKKQAQPRDQSESVDEPTPSKLAGSEPENEAQAENVSSPEVLKDEPELVRATSEVSSSKPLDKIAVSEKPQLSPEPEIEPLRDAGRGKVRGVNGRFQSKGKPAKPGRKSKNATRAKSIGPRSGSKSRASDDSESIFADVQSPSPSAQDASEINASILTTNDADDSGDRAASEPASTPSYILAAEAEAVASNLDRLPPGFARRPNKRKSEPASQQGERKRGRHGGIVGRPRRSEQKVATPNQETNLGAEEEMEEEMPRMTTRRTTRRSGIPALNEDASAGHEVNAFESIDAIKTSEPTAEPTTARQGLENIQADATAQPENLQEPREDDHAGVTAQLEKLPEHREDRSAGATTPLQQQRSDSEAAKPTHNPGHVEYFARVHTFTGTLEVPIAADKIDSAEDVLVNKYAEWMAQEGGMDITFKQFCSIFGFARRG